MTTLNTAELQAAVMLDELARRGLRWLAFCERLAQAKATEQAGAEAAEDGRRAQAETEQE